MASAEFIDNDVLLYEATLGVYNLDEAYDSETQEAMKEYSLMKKYTSMRGSRDSNDNIISNLDVIKKAIQYHAKGKSLNQEVDVKDYDGKEFTVNLGKDAVKYCEEFARHMREDAEGSRSIKNNDGSFTKSIDVDKDWHSKHGNVHAALAAADSAQRLAKLIHKWAVQYR